MFTHVAIEAAVHSELLAAVDRARPREMVAALGGAVRGDCACVEVMLPLANLSAVNDAFTVDAVTFARAERTLAATGHRWLGFVHSHVHGAATPSLRDREQLWSNCLQVIVAGETLQLGAFMLRDGCAHPLPLLATATEAQP